MWLDLQWRDLQIETEDCLAHGYFDLWFSVGLRANAKAGIWGVFMTMGPQKLISPPPISENFGEFNNWRRGASSGIFRKFPRKSNETPTKNPSNFSPLIVGTTILKRGSSVAPVSGRGRVLHDIAAEREEEARDDASLPRTTNLFGARKLSRARFLVPSWFF